MYTKEINYVIKRLRDEAFDYVWVDVLTEADRMITVYLTSIFLPSLLMIKNGEVLYFRLRAGKWSCLNLGEPRIELPVNAKNVRRLMDVLPGVTIELKEQPTITPFHQQFRDKIAQIME